MDGLKAYHPWNFHIPGSSCQAARAFFPNSRAVFGWPLSLGAAGLMSEWVNWSQRNSR